MGPYFLQIVLISIVAVAAMRIDWNKLMDHTPDNEL
jgi:hypothetical protein